MHVRLRMVVAEQAVDCDAQNERLAVDRGAAQAEIQPLAACRDPLDVDAAVVKWLVVEIIDVFGIGDDVAELAGALDADNLVIGNLELWLAGDAIYLEAEDRIAGIAFLSPWRLRPCDPVT